MMSIFVVGQRALLAICLYEIQYRKALPQHSYLAGNLVYFIEPALIQIENLMNFCFQLFVLKWFCGDIFMSKNMIFLSINGFIILCH